ncbi:oligosaccharide flippase family protein [Acidihalobacter ferrooxydans]|uniref:Uncharacterized protein n=1 Tax=Acidihalobacter ferrooxydans TaxID=1765967 RepID=A0A1P8UJI4_9GAMM|nr:oligosaccharide flippase family protein [Acidihalobacter ferrooxydans]APZ43970.1 hypothetical protein BW247_13435 [Acidihalobacter ferrooxydans]
MQRLRAWRPGKLAKGTLAMTAGLGLRTLGQAAVFLIVARVLGVEAYGAYSAVLALAMVLGWFVGMGVSGVMLRDTARDAQVFEQAWGRTLAALWITAPPALLLYGALAWLLLPADIHWDVVMGFGVAEILFARVGHAAMQAYQGHERMGRAARMHLAPIVPRVAAILPLVIGVVWLRAPDPLFLWSVLYLIAAALAAVYALARLRQDFGLAFTPVWQGLGRAMRDGWPYALGSASGKVYVDIDKLMLARLGGLEAAGVYSAAYRFVDMAAIPLAGLYGASVARFFRAGEQGVGSAARYALKLLPVPLAYAALTGAVFFVSADLLPWLLGADYAGAAEALRWLAWLPLLSVPRDLLQQAFIGADRQHVFVLVMGCAALLNIVLNLWAIPRWGWQGAVGATYAAEFFMIAWLLTLLLGIGRTAGRRLD